MGGSLERGLWRGGEREEVERMRFVGRQEEWEDRRGCLLWRLRGGLWDWAEVGG